MARKRGKLLVRANGKSVEVFVVKPNDELAGVAVSPEVARKFGERILEIVTEMTSRAP